MFKNCELAAIISKDSQKELQSIPLSRDLQRSIKEEWESQYISFFEEVVKEVNYEPGYKPEKDGLFYLPDYELPDWLAEEDNASIADFESIRNNETQMNLIKGIAAFVQNETDEMSILFQRFMPAQVIRPKLSFIWDRDTFRKIDEPGFMFGRYLSAVYHSAERKLLFTSFYNVDLLLSLPDDLKNDASPEKIREILSHELFAPEDIEVFTTNPSKWFRVRFALLEHLGIINEFTALEIQERSEGYNVTIELSSNNTKIVFPSDETEARKLLQFLNEELFLGAVTKDLYETNSKKKVGQ